MISLETIMEEVSSLGPNWAWIIRSTSPVEEKPGKFLVNVYRHHSEISTRNNYFPVFADEIDLAFAESLRRARAFLSEGVR